VTEAAFERIASTKTDRLLLLCDHASNALPPAYGTLGLPPHLLETHIAYDIGAATITRTLAALYGAAALLGRWSRLLVDLNRGPNDPSLVIKVADGIPIPGNLSADDEEVQRRIAAFRAPYRSAISEEVSRLGAPVLVSVHTFTPVMEGKPRPWEVGVIYGPDRRLAVPLLARLKDAGFNVGDNQPYAGELEEDTLNSHGTRLGLANVLIEIRQDLTADDGMAADFARKLKPILDDALADTKLQNVVAKDHA
jgi:predicted N-formylglutamate amidohydrolase